jgi:hypothetical protein
MKNLLMVVPSFPPQENVGGLRPAMFSKYLPLYNWNPIILTREYPKDDPNYKPTITGINNLPSEDNIIRVVVATGHERIGHNNLHDRINRFFSPELTESWNLIDCYISAFDRSRWRNLIDAVYATTPDYAQVVIGLRISQSLNIPLIVDHRDIAEQDIYPSFRLKLIYFRHLVRRYVTSWGASYAIAVSEQQRTILERRLPVSVNTIVNGYDHEMFFAGTTEKSDNFNITYMGRLISEELRNPVAFFQAIDLLCKDEDIDVRHLNICFYGSSEKILSEMLSGFVCKNVIKAMPRVKYGMVPAIISKSNINLVLTNVGRSGVLTTKFFEYLAVRRPILVVPNDNDSLEAMVKKTRSGFISGDAKEIYSYIKKCYLDWISCGKYLPVVDSVGVEQYSRIKCTEKLAVILDESLACLS